MGEASPPNDHGSDRFRRYRIQMADSTTGAIICTRHAAQDRHGTNAPVPLALCTCAPRRGWVGRFAIHARLTAPAAESAM